MKAYLISMAIFLSVNVDAQTICLENKILRTNFISEGLDSSRLNLPLVFYFSKDSIVAGFSIRKEDEFMSYQILSSDCNFNKNFTEGKGIFMVRFINKNGEQLPKMSVEVKLEAYVRIEILYTDNEKQIFTSH